jgi:hypothetical protein
MTNTKQKPKSCMCHTCRHCVSTGPRKAMRTQEQRAYRHAAKVALKKGDDPIIDAAPHGDRLG